MTDDLGNMVYGAAHDPCAGIQQIKEDIRQNLDDSLNSEPKINILNSDIELSVNGRSDLSSIKFSGKEQDTESGLYYFGARYYDPTLYHFLSPDPADVPEVARYDFQRWNKYSFALNNPVSYFEEKGYFAIKINTKIIEKEWGEYLGKNIKGESVYMMGFGLTEAMVDDIKIDRSDSNDIIITVTFSIFILRRGSPFWNSVDAFISHSSFENVLRHELNHVIDVLIFVSPQIAKIEDLWRAGKINWDEAKKEIKKAFSRAAKASADIRDNWIMEYIRYLEYWIGDLFGGYDPFWNWALEPFLLSLISFAYKERNLLMANNKKISALGWIIIITLSLAVLPIFYKTILSWHDNRLIQKSELLKEGMTEQQVIEIMGKPKHKELISFDVAIGRGLPVKFVKGVNINVNDLKILWYCYYSPDLLKLNVPVYPGPYNTVVYVFFDGNKRVCYVLKGKVAEDLESLFPRPKGG
ncbi:MAG: RHS repeat-associated core domain-containing protein [Candidatus Saccharicenans sp.]